jgi:hypothetical protein
MAGDMTYSMKWIEHTRGVIEAADLRSNVGQKIKSDRRLEKLPYRFQPTENEEFRCVVGRNYKPITDHELEWAFYELYLSCHVSEETLQELIAEGLIDARGYLYGEATSPDVSEENLRVYLAKLERVLAVCERSFTQNELPNDNVTDSFLTPRHLTTRRRSVL